MTHWWGYFKYEHVFYIFVYYRKLLSRRIQVKNECTIHKLSHHRNHGEGKIGVHRIWVKSTADQLLNLEYTTHKLSHHRNHGEGKIGLHRIWVKSTQTSSRILNLTSAAKVLLLCCYNSSLCCLGQQRNSMMCLLYQLLRIKRFWGRPRPVYFAGINPKTLNKRIWENFGI
jgi:hypothetical protein